MRFLLDFLWIFKFSKIAATLGHGRASRRMGPSWICDVGGGSHFDRKRKHCVRSQKNTERMLDRCVVANCGNTGDPPNRIYVHAIPYFGDSRPEALNRRKKWVDFVKLKRAQWQDTKYSVVCSEPFKRDDYIHWYPKLPGLDKTPVPKLRRDKLGIVVFPTVQSNKASETPLSSRTKRKVWIFIIVNLTESSFLR